MSTPVHDPEFGKRSEREEKCFREWRKALLAGDTESAAHWRAAGLTARSERIFAGKRPEESADQYLARTRRKARTV